MAPKRLVWPRQTHFDPQRHSEFQRLRHGYIDAPDTPTPTSSSDEDDFEFVYRAALMSGTPTPIDSPLNTHPTSINSGDITDTTGKRRDSNQVLRRVSKTETKGRGHQNNDERDHTVNHDWLADHEIRLAMLGENNDATSITDKYDIPWYKAEFSASREQWRIRIARIEAMSSEDIEAKATALTRANWDLLHNLDSRDRAVLKCYDQVNESAKSYAAIQKSQADFMEERTYLHRVVAYLEKQIHDRDEGIQDDTDRLRTTSIEQYIAMKTMIEQQSRTISNLRRENLDQYEDIEESAYFLGMAIESQNELTIELNEMIARELAASCSKSSPSPQSQQSSQSPTEKTTSQGDPNPMGTSATLTSAGASLAQPVDYMTPVQRDGSELEKMVHQKHNKGKRSSFVDQVTQVKERELAHLPEKTAPECDFEPVRTIIEHEPGVAVPFAQKQQPITPVRSTHHIEDSIKDSRDCVGEGPRVRQGHNDASHHELQQVLNQENDDPTLRSYPNSIVQVGGGTTEDNRDSGYDSLSEPPRSPSTSLPPSPGNTNIRSTEMMPSDSGYSTVPVDVSSTNLGHQSSQSVPSNFANTAPKGSSISDVTNKTPLESPFETPTRRRSLGSRDLVRSRTTDAISSTGLDQNNRPSAKIVEQWASRRYLSPKPNQPESATTDGSGVSRMPHSATSTFTRSPSRSLSPPSMSNDNESRSTSTSPTSSENLSDSLPPQICKNIPNRLKPAGKRLSEPTPYPPQTLVLSRSFSIPFYPSMGQVLPTTDILLSSRSDATSIESNSPASASPPPPGLVDNRSDLTPSPPGLTDSSKEISTDSSDGPPTPGTLFRTPVTTRLKPADGPLGRRAIYEKVFDSIERDSVNAPRQSRLIEEIQSYVAGASKTPDKQRSHSIQTNRSEACERLQGANEAKAGCSGSKHFELKYETEDFDVVLDIKIKNHENETDSGSVSKISVADILERKLYDRELWSTTQGAKKIKCLPTDALAHITRSSSEPTVNTVSSSTEYEKSSHKRAVFAAIEDEKKRIKKNTKEWQLSDMKTRDAWVSSPISAPISLKGGWSGQSRESDAELDDNLETEDSDVKKPSDSSHLPDSRTSPSPGPGRNSDMQETPSPERPSPNTTTRSSRSLSSQQRIDTHEFGVTLSPFNNFSSVQFGLFGPHMRYFYVPYFALLFYLLLVAWARKEEWHEVNRAQIRIDVMDRRDYSWGFQQGSMVSRFVESIFDRIYEPLPRGSYA